MNKRMGLVWAGRAALAGTVGSWLILSKVTMDYIVGGKSDISSGRELMALGFSMALIGFVSGMTINVGASHELKATVGKPILSALCTYVSALLILLCLGIVVIAPHLFTPVF